MIVSTDTPTPDRRHFLIDGLRTTGAMGLIGLAGYLVGRRSQSGELVWQIDPSRCIACGNCATHCVLDESAVKCVDNFSMCGYCDLCTGYFEPNPYQLHSGAENQLCPTGALLRRFIEDPYFEYPIDEASCIGCGKCVKGCVAFGNGSLQLQVRHDRCVNCNQCSIALACPSQAFVRVPATSAYMLKYRSAQG
jgi:electron transport complex protein RnfB